MNPSRIARRTGAWIVAAALWLYVLGGVVAGLPVALNWPYVGLLSLTGAGLVATGLVHVRRQRPVVGAMSLIAGGILMGAYVGLVAAAFSTERADMLIVGSAIGVVFVGWPPMVTGVALLVSSSRRRGWTAPRTP
jgi:hypothetical protein